MPRKPDLDRPFWLACKRGKESEAEFSDPLQPMATENDSPELKTDPRVAKPMFVHDAAPGAQPFASVNTADSPDSISTTVPVPGNASEERNDPPAAN